MSRSPDEPDAAHPAVPADAAAQRREIIRLAVPAFLALVAEPLYLLADSVIIGHLGTTQLAGLGVASTALVTAVGVFVFLAYGTTSVVARKLGADDTSGAVGAGIDGMWLALVLGAITALATGVFAETICGWFGASPEALGHAATYLRISAVGIPAMLVVLAVTGVLRGLQDTRTPLVASVIGFGANILLNVLFVYGFGWGIGGSALGTVIAQTGMSAGLVWVLVRGARRVGASLRPHPLGVLWAARDGVPLLVRTIGLRAALLATMWVAAGLGDVPLAAHQVVLTVWTFLAFALDALAVAAQALTGKALGASDIRAVRSTTQLMVRWGVVGGIGVGLVLVALAWVLPAAFTTDAALRAAMTPGLILAGLGQGVAGYVFVLDGVLIGAGDGVWLAWASVITLLAYLPMLLALRWHGSTGDSPRDVMWLWLAFSGFMVVRGAILGWRARRDTWMVTGAGRSARETMPS